jgi:hypothetical protein
MLAGSESRLLLIRPSNGYLNMLTVNHNEGKYTILVSYGSNALRICIVVIEPLSIMKFSESPANLGAAYCCCARARV